MADLVGQHTGDLAVGQPAQEAVGDGERRILTVPEAEAVERRARHVVQRRCVVQPGACRQLTHQSVQVRCHRHRQRFRPVQRQHQSRRDLRSQRQEDRREDHRPQQPGSGEQQPPDPRDDDQQGAEQQGALDDVAGPLAAIRPRVQHGVPTPSVRVDLARPVDCHGPTVVPTACAPADADRPVRQGCTPMLFPGAPPRAVGHPSWVRWGRRRLRRLDEDRSRPASEAASGVSR